jgi:hypothetical protein
MSRLQQGSTFLYDVVTGDIVGVRDQDGSEHLFVFDDLPADVIKFNTSPTNTPDQVGEMGWNAAEDTLDLKVSGDVTLQLGLEEHARALNNSGALIGNGQVAGLNGVNLGTGIGISKYLADGATPPLYVIGVATQDIADGTRGRVTVRGFVHDLDTTGALYGETWLIGDLLYASSTVPGGLTKVQPVPPALVVPIAIVVAVSATVGVIAVRPTIFLQFYYGAFLSTAIQTAGAINTPQAATFNTTVLSSGVALGTPTSRVVLGKPGLYFFQIAVQADNTSASAAFLWFWIRRNGVDEPNTAAKIVVQGNPGNTLLTRMLPIICQANDYIEIMWAVSSTNARLLAEAAAGSVPATPSVSISVFQNNQ